MWVVYQFLVSVVLLRILIVMLTFTFNKILANLDSQWKYEWIYLVIQFFDADTLLPPPHVPDPHHVPYPSTIKDQVL